MNPFAFNNLGHSMECQQELELDRPCSVGKNCLSYLEDRPEFNLKIYMRSNKLRIDLRIPQIQEQDKQLSLSYNKKIEVDDYFEQLQSLENENMELKDWFDSLEDLCQYMTQDNNTNIKVDLLNKTIKIYINIEAPSKRQVQIHEIKLRKIIPNPKKEERIEEQNPKKLKYQDINNVLKEMSTKLIYLIDANYNDNNQYKGKNQTKNVQQKNQVAMSQDNNISKQKNQLIRGQIFTKMEILQAKILEQKQRHQEKFKSIQENLNAMCKQIDNKANRLEQRLIGNKDGVQHVEQSIVTEVKMPHNNTEICNKYDFPKIAINISADKNQYQGHNKKSMKKEKVKEIKEIMNKTKQQEKCKQKQGDKDKKNKEDTKRRKKLKEEIKQNDKKNTITSQISFLQTKKQSRNNNSSKKDQILSQYQFEQQLEQQTVKINGNEKKKTLTNIPRPSDTRTIYRIKGILQQKKSQPTEIPSFIDSKSAYICCYKFDKNKVRMDKILVGIDRKAIILLGSTCVRQKSVFTFNILSCDPHVMMGIGITDRKYRKKRNLKAGENVIRIGSKGYILDGNKSEKVGDFIFSQGDSLVMRIHIQYCLVEWIVNNQASYSCRNTNLKNNSIQWVPFVEMRRIGDCIQWIQ